MSEVSADAVQRAAAHREILSLKATRSVRQAGGEHGPLGHLVSKPAAGGEHVPLRTREADELLCFAAGASSVNNDKRVCVRG